MRYLLALVLVVAACKKTEDKATPTPATPTAPAPSAPGAPAPAAPAAAAPAGDPGQPTGGQRATVECAVAKWTHEDGSFIDIRTDAKGEELHGDAKASFTWTWNDDTSLRLNYIPEPGMQPQSKIVKLDCPAKTLTDTSDDKAYKKP